MKIPLDPRGPEAQAPYIRTTLTVYVICFSLGIISHARDFLTHGWRPYRWGVPLLEIFWTSLILLDLTVVTLILAGYRRAGLLAAFSVMTFDVAANSYALLALHIQAFAGNLVLQTLFFGFVLGSIAFIWPKKAGPF